MSKKAFTLIELMITLVIIALLFGTGYFYMSGYLPKQRLITTATYLESLLKETQSKAITKGDYRYGIVFKKDADNNRHFACVFADSDSSWACTNCTDCLDCSCGEMVNQRSLLFKQDIELKDGCSTNAVRYSGDQDDPYTDTIIFDLKGISYSRSGTDTATGVTTPQKPFNFEIFLVSKREGIGLKEIEVNSGGMIETIRTGQAGNIPGQVGIGSCVE